MAVCEGKRVKRVEDPEPGHAAGGEQQSSEASSVFAEAPQRALHRRSSTSNHQALNSHRQETTAVIHNWIEKVGSPAEIKNIEGSTVLKKSLNSDSKLK